MWDRLRQRDGGAPLNRKKLETWQNAHSSSSTSTTKPTKSAGIKGGNGAYRYAIQGGPTPQRPPRSFELPPEQRSSNQGYNRGQPQGQPPSAGVRYQNQSQSQNRNSSYGRPASSIYSQPSPEAATFAAQQLRNDVARYDSAEISPPSSPDVASPRNGPDPGDVSPIDELPDMSRSPTNDKTPPRADSRSSNIPMMRRERRKNTDAAMKASRNNLNQQQQRPHGNDVRWDPSTGEPTTSNKGRPSQVNPQEFAQGLTNRSTSQSPPQAKPGQQKMFGERVRRGPPPSQNPQAELASRPEWRGASGRTTLVAPVTDQKQVAPLNIPPKNAKRATRDPTSLSPVHSVGSETSSTPAAARRLGSSTTSSGTPSANTIRQMAPSQPITVMRPSPHESSYPSPPLSDDNSVPAKRGHIPPPQRAQTQPFQQPNTSSTSLQVPSNDKAIRRKPAAGGPGHRAEPSTPSSVYSSQNGPHPSQVPPGGFPSDWTQPPSRFSVTTYATSIQDATPRQSADESAPPLPIPPPVPSILDRKRPTLGSHEHHSSRNSPGVEEPVRIAMDSPYYATSPTSTTTTNKTQARPSGPRPAPSAVARDSESVFSLSSNIDKSLPPAPPEKASQDRVEQLNAKVRALGNRRININTAIKQMTELMPTDNILASDAVVRKREDEKRKVETLRKELAEVERESYELGLKLHRAYKRMDRDAEYEPTTLWVRRVTG